MAFRSDIEPLCRKYILNKVIASFPLSQLAVDCDADEVAIRKFPWNEDKIFPGITVHTDRESSGAGTCSTDDTGYAIPLTYVKGTGNGVREDIDRISLFRAHVRGEFNNKKIPVATIWICTVEYGRWILPKQYQDHYDATSMLVRCWSENERI